MPVRSFALIALIFLAGDLNGCRATYRDVSDESPYREHVGQICEVVKPLNAMGYSFELGRNKNTDAITIWHQSFSGPEVTFKNSIGVGTRMVLLQARECGNCPFDHHPEYRVLVSPAPPQFEGKPAYLRADSLAGGHLRCGGVDAPTKHSK